MTQPTANDIRTAFAGIDVITAPVQITQFAVALHIVTAVECVEVMHNEGTAALCQYIRECIDAQRHTVTVTERDAHAALGNVINRYKHIIRTSGLETA